MEKTELYLQTENLNGQKGKVMVKHKLWGEQAFQCESISIINDKCRFGISIHNHDMYVYKPEVVLCTIHENMYTIADKTVQITIIVNKL